MLRHGKEANMTTVFHQPSRATVEPLLRAAGLPTDDLDALDYAHFVAVGDADQPDGVVGIELHGDAALLRSLVVAPVKRGTGDGRALVAAIERHARAHGVRRMYLLTTTAAPFFARLGYRDTPRPDAPDAIRATREFSSLCPSTASFMSREL
jgi:amino-acid N-acetyltransferase